MTQIGQVEQVGPVPPVGLVRVLGLVGPVGQSGQMPSVTEVRRVGDAPRVGQVQHVAHARPALRRSCAALLLSLLVVACDGDAPRPLADRPAANPASDAQHQGITTPHGDHTPHHGGIVLMNGELHYEVVLDPQGAHRVWFSDAVRDELPASIARGVRMTVTRPKEAPELLPMEIDEAGESWVARGRRIEGEGVVVALSYSVQGAAHQVEIPFVPSAR